MLLAEINTHILNVSAQTNWIFVTAHAAGGGIGVGEASLCGMEPMVREAVRLQSGALIGNEIEAARRSIEVMPRSPGGLAWNAAASGIEQALTDLLARMRGVPIHRVLGQSRRDRVAVYANIDRSSADRSAQGFAAAARTAFAQGFSAIKIAPFDDVLPRNCQSAGGRTAIDAGIERVAALRAAASDAEVMVDCRWRFDAATATRVLIELAKLGVTWIECPVSEQPVWWPVLKRLRGLANERGVRIAGGESQVGIASFRPLLEQGLFDAVIPDIKYAGGYREMLRIADLAATAKTAFSPHNGAGPVGNFASLHIGACVPEIDRLEYPLGESVRFFEVVHGKGPRLIDGHFLVPQDPGLCLELDAAVLARHPYLQVPIAPDPRLG